MEKYKTRMLVVGDPHAKRNNLREIRELTKKLTVLAKKEKVNAVVFLGDLANDFDKMYLPAWKEICNLFKTLMQEKIDIYYIVGNHDMLNNQVFQTDDHFFNIFKELNQHDDFIHIIDKADMCPEDNRMAMTPYVAPGRFKEALKTLPQESKSGIKIIFAHQEFMGAKMGAIESRVGDTWPENAPLVISGHIHDRDWLQKNIYYVGSPYQVAFGESTKKVVSIVTIDETDAISIEDFDLGMPKKISIKTDCEGFKKMGEIDHEDFYRIYVDDTMENLNKMKRTAFYKNFTETMERAKVIPRASDPIDIVNPDDIGTSQPFEQILKESVKNESEFVQDAYEEVMRDVLKVS